MYNDRKKAKFKLTDFNYYDLNPTCQTIPINPILKNKTYSSREITNKKFENKKKLLSISPFEFLKEFYDFKQSNLTSHKSNPRSSVYTLHFHPIAQSLTYTNFFVNKGKGKFEITKKKENIKGAKIIKPQKSMGVNEYIENMIKQKENKKKIINNLKEEKKQLTNIYERYHLNIHTINILEAEIEKYKSISNKCKQNYIDLSIEFNKLKVELEKVQKKKLYS